MSKSTPLRNPRYRHRTDTINDILRVIQESEPKGIMKTHLMYASEISSKQLRDYLPYMYDNQLIYTTLGTNGRQADKSVLYFHIDSKGKLFLKLYGKLMHDNDRGTKYIV